MEHVIPDPIESSLELCMDPNLESLAATSPAVAQLVLFWMLVRYARTQFEHNMNTIGSARKMIWCFWQRICNPRRLCCSLKLVWSLVLKGVFKRMKHMCFHCLADPLNVLFPYSSKILLEKYIRTICHLIIDIRHASQLYKMLNYATNLCWLSTV